MHFSALVSAASLLGTAQAVAVHVVAVGRNPVDPSLPQPVLKYFPEKITAQPGDMVQFQFQGGNHTVTQSNFDNPCMPISPGVFSGFMPIPAGGAATQFPVFTVQVNDTKPIWIYCSQGKHCQQGMAMVINENTQANASRSLENYKKLAAGATDAAGESMSMPSGGSNSSYWSGSSNGTATTMIMTQTSAPTPSIQSNSPAAASSGIASLAGSTFDASASTVTMLLLLGAAFVAL
jgi:plastocyanin